MKLSQPDYKLLTYLYHHNRESVAKIAKATGISREQVDYRIKKYYDEGLIKEFVVMFNYSAFGYDIFAALLLKFERHSSVNKFMKEIRNNKNVVSWGRVYGKYDLYINSVFKNEKELGDF